MRSLQRRKQDIWLCWAIVGDESIEPTATYTKPVKIRVTVSNTSGTPHELPVGTVAEYSRYFISFDRDFHPEEGMVLFVDRTPRLTDEGELELKENGDPVTRPDYVLTHVMDTARGTIARYGIKKIAGEEEEEEETPDDQGDDDEQDDQDDLGG